MFVWSPAFLSERDILPHRQSQLSDLTIRLHITTFLKSISQKRWLYNQIFKWSFWPVQFFQCQSRDQSFFVLIGQWIVAEATVKVGHKYVNVHRHHLLISSDINNVWSMTVTVLQRKASTQQIGLLLVPAIKGAVYINTHCNYSQRELTKLYNENIGGHPYTFTIVSSRLSCYPWYSGKSWGPFLLHKNGRCGLEVTWGHWITVPLERLSVVSYSHRHGPTLYHCWDKACYWSKIAIFPYPFAFDVPVKGSPSEYCNKIWYKKLDWRGYQMVKTFDDASIHFDTTHNT